jgi:hypothetical protein
MSLQMAVPTAPETERIFGALSEGGTIRMGRFGINWIEGYAR